MITRLAVRSPAKINLALRVIDRRPDGYHELDTVFQAIDLWDRLEVGPGDSLRLISDEPRLPADESNLVLRAARRLAARSGLSAPRGTFTLHKAIPIEAGLGGGSSDAAAALVLCRAYWRLSIGPTELRDIAAEIGADVPFFLHGGTARGRGRGDRIEPLPFAGPLRFLLGCPPFGVSTAEVFRQVSDRLTLPQNGVSLALPSAHKWPQENDFGSLANDLEAIVFEGWPELKHFRDALRGAGARAALLSGSGSSVYGIFTDDDEIERAAGRLRNEFSSWRLVATRAVPGGVCPVAPRTRGA